MTSAADPVAAAEALAARVAESADAVEAGRGLPAELVEQLARAGLLQLFVRRSLGGPGADPVTACRAIEVLARADASTAWCAMVSSTSGYLTGWLAADEAAAMFGTPADLRIAGSSRPLGRAVPVDGGYRVSGRWDFASGIGHANWLLASCLVDGGGPRIAFAPARDGVIDETWDTIGMRGTGSHDLVIDDVFVPVRRTAWFEDEPDEALALYDRRLVRVATHAPAVAVALGAARGAVDAFVELAEDAATTSSSQTLRQRREVQIAVARADAGVDAARCRFYDAVAAAWDAVESGRPDTRREVARARSAMAVAGASCLDSATTLLQAAGTTGVFTRNRIERRVRDLYVIGRFSAFSTDNLAGVGQVLLGLEPEGLGW